MARRCSWGDHSEPGPARETHRATGPTYRQGVSVSLSGQRLGYYAVGEIIGRGGMSVVYRAVDERLDRVVALKVMSENLCADPEFRARFAGEARAAAAVDHANVVPLYDVGEQCGRLFLAMRLVPGSDLARELTGGALPPARALHLLGQVGAALDALHDCGLVHLDVKPANVLITTHEPLGTEHVYLADFGLTRRDAIGSRTRGGDFLGSPTYASPEHLRAQDIGRGADQYSLACVLFTTLAGRPPFLGDVRSVVTGHLSGAVPSLAALTGLPSALDRVLTRAMATDPAERYGRAGDLIAAARMVLEPAGADPGRSEVRNVSAQTISSGPPPPDGAVLASQARPRSARHRLVRNGRWLSGGSSPLGRIAGPRG